LNAPSLDIFVSFVFPPTQLRDEAQSLLSVDALGTRITQLDGIIKRKQSKVLFSMETSSGQPDQKQKTTIGQDSERKYQVVEELLKKVLIHSLNPKP
jgi:hypothetical protein